jgi:hypothetical protein
MVANGQNEVLEVSGGFLALMRLPGERDWRLKSFESRTRVMHGLAVSFRWTITTDRVFMSPAEAMHFFKSTDGLSRARVNRKT